MSDDKPKGRAAVEEIATRLGDLAGHLRDAFEQVERAARNADDPTRDSGASGRAGDGAGEAEFDIPTAGGPRRARASWGVRVRSVADVVGGEQGDGRSAADRAEHSDNRDAATREAASAPAPREPHVEIFDEPDAWILTAELPGVRADELTVEAVEDALVFETVGARRFAHRATAPAGVDLARREVRLTNGILEIRSPKIA